MICKKRREQRNSRNFFGSASSQHRNTATQRGGGGGGGGGGFTVKKKNFTVSQLRALATRTPSLGRVDQGAWELGFAQTRRRYFFVTLAWLDISSKKRCL